MDCCQMWVRNERDYHTRGLTKFSHLLDIVDLSLCQNRNACYITDSTHEREEHQSWMMCVNTKLTTILLYVASNIEI